MQLFYLSLTSVLNELKIKMLRKWVRCIYSGVTTITGVWIQIFIWEGVVFYENESFM